MNIESLKAEMDATRHKLHAQHRAFLRWTLPILLWGPSIAATMLAIAYGVPWWIVAAFWSLGVMFGYARASRERMISEDNLEHISALERQILLNAALDERAGR